MHVVVPVKRFSQAKRRLAARLLPAQRAALAQAMLEDVLEALAGVRGIARVIVVSDEPALRWLATARPVSVQAPLQDGLNPALQGLLRSLEPGPVLVLHADLPLLQAPEVQALVDAAGAARPVVAVADRHGRGTNALLLPRPEALAPRFGEGSLAHHRAAARQAGLPFRVARLPSLALDVDEPADLAALLRAAAADGGAPARRSVALVQGWLGAAGETAHGDAPDGARRAAAVSG